MTKTASLLLVEDDVDLATQVVACLRRAGFRTTWWASGEALSIDSIREFELILLDLMLPHTHGLDLLAHIRACSEIPVLVLTARSDTADKVRAFRLGADDYMTKPFWPEELLERVRARLRRPVLVRSDAVELGPLRVDASARTVELEGQRVELTPIEFALLWSLARRPGAALTRAWLVDQALASSEPADERLLDAHMSRLRKKLGRPDLIKTVWGIGYKLAVDARA